MQACTELEINAVLWTGEQMIHTTQTWNIMDGLELIDDADKDSVTLMILDLPYYKVVKNGWDNQWKTLDDYLDWCKAWFIKSDRALKNNGSLYYFNSQYPVLNAVDGLITSKTSLRFRQHITIDKGWQAACSHHGVHDGIRSYPPGTEFVNWYTFQDESGLTSIYSNRDCFKPIKDYMRGEYQKVMDANGFKTKAECDTYLNNITDTNSIVTHHYFADSQYCFPTLELYMKLRKTGFFVRNYEDLRQDYEDLRQDYEDLRYNFNYQDHSYDVWHFNFYKERRYGHPTQKSFDLIKRIVLTSSNEGDVVCDPAMGTGTTMKVCEVHNRNFIGAEIDPDHEQVINNRCMTHTPPLTAYL